MAASAGQGGFVRSLDVLDRSTARRRGNERLAWAALLGEVDAAGARTALERLRVAGREREAVCLLVEQAAGALPAGVGRRGRAPLHGPSAADLLDDLLALRLARAEASGGAAAGARGGPGDAECWRSASAGSALALAGLAIDGRDLQSTLGITEGPAIGRHPRCGCSRDVIEDPSLNRRLTLLTRAGLILDELVQGGAGGPDGDRRWSSLDR